MQSCPLSCSHTSQSRNNSILLTTSSTQCTYKRQSGNFVNRTWKSTLVRMHNVSCLSNPAESTNRTPRLPQLIPRALPPRQQSIPSYQNSISIENGGLSPSLRCTSGINLLLLLLLLLLLHHICNAKCWLDANSLLRQKVNQQRAWYAVAMGLEGRLTLLVFLNILKVHVEQVRGIERASLSFWVELSGEDGSRIVDETCTVLDIGIIIGI